MTLRAIPAVSLSFMILAVAGCTHKTPVAHTTAPVTRAPEPAPMAKAQPATTMRREAATPAAESQKSRYPDQKTLARIDDLLTRIQDAYFDYDKHSLRPDAEQTLRSDAKTLAEIIRQYPDFRLVVEGHCDERGSDEYNMALGDARAQKAKEYLVTLGLPGGQMNTVSYGKQKPVCTASDEDCWQKNRRAHLARAEQRAGL